jgi:chromosome transmission fidelity protein 1
VGASITHFVSSLSRQGKTLSLLTASLTWLEDEKNRARKGKMKGMLGDESTANGSLPQSVSRLFTHS